MLGEWFNTIALFFLILEYTGSEFLLGMLFTVRMAGFAILQPFIGLLADRYNRKTLMVVSNLLQAGFALCFLLVNDSSDIVWMIGLSGLMMVLHGVYMTAERAALPNVVSEEDLATANALDAASWSTALCIGAMLGGVVVSIWGTDAAFIVDSLTFLVGTLFLINLTIPQTIDESMKGPWLSTGIQNIKSGWRRIRRQPALFRIVFARHHGTSPVEDLPVFTSFSWAPMCRDSVLPLASDCSSLHVASVQAWAPFCTCLPEERGSLAIACGLPHHRLRFRLFPGWHQCFIRPLDHRSSGDSRPQRSGANWVLSTVMMQQWVEDEVRGRVFSTDMLILSVAFSTSTSVAGYLMENTDLGIQNGIMMFASVMVLSGIAFSLWRPESPSINHHFGLKTSFVRAHRGREITPVGGLKRVELECR